MTLDEFIKKYNGKKVDFDGAYGSQCVDLFRFYNKEVLEIPQPKSVNGAKDFWSNYSSDSILNQNFQKIANTPEFIALPGDVMIWNGYYGQFGHIAIVTKADINNFACLSQNDPVGRETHLKEYTYSKVYGVLRPNKQVSSETIQVLKSDFENLVKNSSEYDLFKNAGYPTLKSVEEIVNSLKENINDIKNEYDKFVLDIVSKLNPTGTLAPVTDKNYALQLIESLISEKDTLEVAKKKLEDESSKREKSLEEEIYRQEQSLKSLKVEVERLLKRVETAESENERLKENKDENNWFSELINLFKRK